MKKMKILIADDDNDLLLLLKKIVEEQEHEVITVKSGIESLNEWNNSFDLFITDINMAESFDGIIASNIISRLKNIPIIFISGKNIEDYKPHIKFNKWIFIEKSRDFIEQLLTFITAYQDDNKLSFFKRED